VALARLAAREGWATIDLVWRENQCLFHARKPVPGRRHLRGPATGAAAAALGGYLREIGAIEPPSRFVVLQGHHMARPSTLIVDVTADSGAGIRMDQSGRKPCWAGCTPTTITAPTPRSADNLRSAASPSTR
jgi:predicted PhzF superfamily epimerase YddE/YHI9